jgi:hypothetical protein
MCCINAEGKKGEGAMAKKKARGTGIASDAQGGTSEGRASPRYGRPAGVHMAPLAA